MTTNASERYEVLFVAIPGLTNEEATTIESQLRELVSQNKGKVISHDKWGKYHLAYEINDNQYGVYFLSRFELPSIDAGKIIEQLRHFFAVKYSESVLRHLFTHLAANAPLEYKRPESMEEAPTGRAREDGREGRNDEGFERRRPHGRRAAAQAPAKEADFEVEEVGEEI